MDMSISETITITNNGNATAKFKWAYNTNGGLFVPSPEFDEVPAKSSKTARITFSPNGPKPDEE
jgi:predicted secreted protein